MPPIVPSVPRIPAQGAVPMNRSTNGASGIEKTRESAGDRGENERRRLREDADEAAGCAGEPGGGQGDKREDDGCGGDPDGGVLHVPTIRRGILDQCVASSGAVVR